MSVLYQEEIRGEHADPALMLYVLHGIYGAGRNWASVVRRLVRSRPEWRARLIDLRQHGGSQGFPPPHTVRAAARDLFELAQLQKEIPAAILGHSFGGKVALMYAREHGEALRQIWIIDSTPEALVPDGSAWQMLQTIRELPREFENREQLVRLLEQAGIARPTAQWMATNLENQGGVYRWRFDFDAMEQLLRDFFDQDLWDVLETPPGEAEVHLVKAAESSVLSSEAVSRIHQIGMDNHRVFLHQVAGGHWVNAENPEALLSLLTQHLWQYHGRRYRAER